MLDVVSFETSSRSMAHEWEDSDATVKVTLCEFCGEVTWGCGETGDQCADSNCTSHHKCQDKAAAASCNFVEPSQVSVKGGDRIETLLKSVETFVCDTRMCVGISSIPHPAKVSKGGEDAYFLSEDMTVIGVADGVGGWGDIGVDSSLYSKSLMEGGKLASEGEFPSRDPVEIMNEAYIYSSCVQGSSTCCIIVLDGVHLTAANLGDSGFMVLRGQNIVYRTKEQQHSFNFPYQIGTGSADRPDHSQRIAVTVQPGDVIIAGTDGLWDNLYDEDILEVLAESSTMDPATAAQCVARKAHTVANDKDALSPFSRSARQNGYPLACGGKLDDITVLVAKIVPGFSDDLGGVEPMMLAA